MVVVVVVVKKKEEEEEDFCNRLSVSVTARRGGREITRPFAQTFELHKSRISTKKTQVPRREREGGSEGERAR